MINPMMKAIIKNPDKAFRKAIASKTNDKQKRIIFDFFCGFGGFLI
jgi:hypothetical protein